jgi:hypothetical protein
VAAGVSSRSESGWRLRRPAIPYRASRYRPARLDRPKPGPTPANPPHARATCCRRNTSTARGPGGSLRTRRGRAGAGQLSLRGYSRAPGGAALKSNPVCSQGVSAGLLAYPTLGPCTQRGADARQMNATIVRRHISRHGQGLVRAEPPGSRHPRHQGADAEASLRHCAPREGSNRRGVTESVTKPVTAGAHMRTCRTAR